MNLSKYFDEIASAYHEAYKQFDAWRTERENAKEAFKKKADKLTPEAVREENAKMVEEFESKSAAIRAELSEKVAKSEDAFKQEVKSFYAVDGKKIDEADMAALKSGIMTENEISEMVIKHSENPTMLRIIRKYSIDNKMMFESKIERALRLASKNGENELRALEGLKNNLKCAVDLATGNYSRELFLNTALKESEYVQDAKIDLLKAKLFIDEKTMEELEKYESDQIAESQKNYDPHNVDYNWF